MILGFKWSIYYQPEIKLIIQNIYKKIKNKFILYIYIYAPRSIILYN